MSSFGRNGGVVLSEAHLEGLNPDEVTLAEILKERGYATACVGKWHLGHLAPFSPRQHGFDAFYGLMFPNDMKPFVLHRDETIIEPHPDQKTLTEQFTDEAVKFVRAKRDQPFFLYLAYSAPHIPLHVSDGFQGKSARGLYGDVVECMDWGVGEVLKALDETGLADRTLVVFTSDNGPDTRGPYDKRGQAFPLRAAKATTREGGVRVPCVMRWPGQIPAGMVSSEIASAMDILPTVAGITRAQPPQDRLIDLVHALATPYRQGAVFVMNSATLARVRKFKDTTGAFLWQPALTADQPATLLGYPVVEAAAMPDVALDSLSIAFGNFQAGYLIAQRRETVVLRDPFSNKPFVHFYATKRVGGAVIDSRAIKLMKFNA